LKSRMPGIYFPKLGGELFFAEFLQKNRERRLPLPIARFALQNPAYWKVSTRSTTVSWVRIVNSLSIFSPLLTTEIL